ncbi:hypothetical protein [Tumebacillus flagellatus]|uniref:Uncharacterized protein n=1 Tax=Tumebacillus flagellatus TaxID=1157490 RepID=A0A074MD00_9BACL|nr:hypothetical protein [Tumebacillus flagellatus]KEO83757.1 hypothetical protein EL26_08900 [Tumebacillus flagellatus]
MFVWKLLVRVCAAQVVIVLFILIKILGVPYMVWRLLGTSGAAMVTLDVATILCGTGAALSMGWLGYQQARGFRRARRVREGVWHMVCIHGPAFAFLLYKFMHGAAWDTHLLLLLSGWVSMISHPMNLVGFYGPWVDGAALVAMAGVYLLGVFVYHDEQRQIPPERLPIRFKKSGS